MKSGFIKCLATVAIQALVCLMLGAGLWSCKDENLLEDTEQLVFNGDAQLKGVAFVENIATGTQDTAYRAELRLYKPNNRDKTLVMSLTKGTFEINNLGAGEYVLEVRQDRRPAAGAPAVVYKYVSETISLKDTDQLSDMRLVLQPDLTSLADPSVQLTVVDGNGLLRPMARVCLFGDEPALLQNYRKCLGSLRTGITNNRGIVVFTGLQARSYYAVALAPNGRDSLTNVRGSQPLQVGPLTTAGFSQQLVVTQSSIPPAAPVAPGLRLTIVDANNIVLPAARVCLYPAQSFLTSSGLDCLNSLRSDSTNTQGQVTFTDLQASTTYYVKAVKVLGTATLTNLGTSAVQTATTGTQGVNPQTITVRP